MTQLTTHFALAELCASQAATRLHMDNRPGPGEVQNLQRVARTLEEIRMLVDRPIIVSSGYRAPAVNKAVGGSNNSAHMRGLAADINAQGMTARELAVRIKNSNIEFDQLIFEGTWVHVGLSEGKPRRQVLTATFTQSGVTYSQGIA